jgi:thymidylate synthase (FAD)
MTDITVELIDHMGTDLSVVDAARVSFAKKSEWEWEDDPDDWAPTPVLSEKDGKLIGYLAKHNHWSPFAHAFASFRIKAPIFVARQLVKHQVGLAWNEESRRYIDDEPEFYDPAEWRKKPEGSIKQGSSDETVNLSTHYAFEHATGESWDDYGLHELEDEHRSRSIILYNSLLRASVAPEMARMVLPLYTMTNWIWSGSLMAFARVCKLRLDPHAQAETRVVAEGIATEMIRLFPVSWKELMK